MYYSARRSQLSTISLLLCLALLFSSLFNAAVSYAEGEGEQEQTVDEDLAPEQDPLAPQNLRIVEGSITHNSVQFVWDFIGADLDPPNGNYIDVWKAYPAENENDYITDANLWHHSIGQLKPETTYSIYITWHERPATKAHRSNIVTFTTLEDTTEYKEAPLAPPQNLKVSTVTDSYITFQWTGSPGADGYDFYLNGGYLGGIWDGSNSFTYPWPENQNETDFKFTVGAQKNAGGIKTTSKDSNIVHITRGTLAPPKDLQIVTANRSTVALGWAPVPGATAYDIYQDDKLIGTTDTSRYVAKGLKESQAYQYAIAARNGVWESSKSDSITAVPGANYTNVTYFAAWSIFDRKFFPENVDVSQVTHINYAFADICWRKAGTKILSCQNKDIELQKDYVYDGEIIIGDNDADLKNYAAFADIKKNNPNLKMMVSVGGWSWSKNFSNVAADEVTRRTFANSAVKFLRAYELDGLDIDWEYPVEGGEDHNVHSPNDKQNFTLLMKTVREALDAAGSEDGKYYLLTIASGQGDNFVVNADLANSTNYLDFISIMTYDYSGGWETLANHNAPLYHDSKLPKPSAPRNNVRGGALGHLNGGVPDYKLVLGVPFYGKGWEGCEPPGQYSTCAGPSAGQWEKGIYDYTELETNYVDKNGYTRYWNDAAKVSYVYNPEKKIFITYNDRTSMIYSASLVKTLNLAGTMNWEVSGDRNRTLIDQLKHDLPIDGKVNPDALAAPSNVAVVASTPTSLQVKWDAVAEATGYEVFINNQYVGYTETTQYDLKSLTASTNYNIDVFAIVKEAQQVEAVSPASKTLRAATQANPSSGYVQLPSYVPPTPDKDSNELDTTVVKTNGKWRINVAKDTAIKSIKAAKEHSFTIKAGSEASAIEVYVPKEVIQALVEKGADTSLVVIWNGISYKIPAEAINRNTDIRITIAPPDADTAAAIDKLAKDSGLTLRADALDFKIEKLVSGDTYEEITDFGEYNLHRSYTLDANSLDTKRSTGVIYLPDSKEFRSVSTVFTEGKDGKVTAELKRKGNSIYTIVESNRHYKDVTMPWAQQAVDRASARLIVSGETADRFGASSNITRAEFTAVLIKGLGILPDYKHHPFLDVRSGAQYAGDIASAQALGLIQGKTADTFQPNGLITRQEMAAILARAWQYAGLSAKANDAVLDRFSDKAAISGYAKASVALMAEQQIMQGVSSSRFSPQTHVTKAQAVVAIIRLLDAIELSKQTAK
ncbi:glycoside hydrolase [Paenibacillaceae bacterium]|nr:glycoside hydrolase [Paenibacillaceae bacterium]